MLTRRWLHSLPTFPLFQRLWPGHLNKGFPWDIVYESLGASYSVINKRGLRQELMRISAFTLNSLLRLQPTGTVLLEFSETYQPFLKATLLGSTSDDMNGYTIKCFYRSTKAVYNVLLTVWARYGLISHSSKLIATIIRLLIYTNFRFENYLTNIWKSIWPRFCKKGQKVPQTLALSYFSCLNAVVSVDGQDVGECRIYHEWLYIYKIMMISSILFLASVLWNHLQEHLDFARNP